MKLIHGFDPRHLRGDIFGGITAAVVALPLALAFGVASGAIAGLYGAIFVGLFSALFGGTPAQVSGPTGPMTVVMAVVITDFAAATALGRLDEAGSFEALVVDLSDVPTIDGSAAVAVEQIVDRTLAADKPAFVCGLQDRPRATLERLGILDKLHPEHHAADRLAAIEGAARSLVDARRVREG